MIFDTLLPQLFLCLCSVLLVSASTCPTLFSLKNGHCIHTSTNTKTYCDAQTFCHSIGGELAFGERVTQYPTITNGIAYFIGMNDFLDEVGSFSFSKRRKSYRWTNGLFAPEAKFASEYVGRLQCESATLVGCG